jgi:hypothetical protein
MIFYDRDGYWEHNGAHHAGGRSGIKLKKVIKDLVRYAHRDDPGAYLKKMLFTTDADWIVSVLSEHRGTAQAKLQAMLADASLQRMPRTGGPSI